jgi:hypothetical protein
MSMSASLRRAVAYFEGGAAADYGDETVALPADYFVGCEEPKKRNPRGSRPSRPKTPLRRRHRPRRQPPDTLGQLQRETASQ